MRNPRPGMGFPLPAQRHSEYKSNVFSMPLGIAPADGFGAAWHPGIENDWPISNRVFLPPICCHLGAISSHPVAGRPPHGPASLHPCH